MTKYKGDKRDHRLQSGKVTSDERKRIKAILKKRNLSMSDWVMQMVAKEEAKGKTQ
jgi:hypothetical protein